MEFILSLLFNKDFPVLAHNVGLAGLTILIPVAIAIFTGDKDFRELDNHVILDHVIQAKRLLVYSALIFFPVFFWHDSPILLRIVELIAWGIGVYFLVDILMRSYKWLKGNKFPMRFEFLETMKDKKDMEESWSSVWGSEKVNSKNENDFFKIFAKRVDKLFETNGK